MDSKLLCEVIQGIETVAGIETFLVFLVATLDFFVVAGRVGANELVPDAKRGSGGFKERREIAPAVGKAIGELKAVIRLNTFHPDSPASIPLDQLIQEIGRGVGELFGVGS